MEFVKRAAPLRLEKVLLSVPPSEKRWRAVLDPAIPLKKAEFLSRFSGKLIERFNVEI